MSARIISIYILCYVCELNVGRDDVTLNASIQGWYKALKISSDDKWNDKWLLGVDFRAISTFIYLAAEAIITVAAAPVSI